MSNWTYDRFAVGYVLSGWFDYRCGDESCLVPPGAVILGNAGDEFQVRHHGRSGNRRLVASLDESILPDSIGTERQAEARFQVCVVPPGRIATQIFALLRYNDLSRCPDRQRRFSPLLQRSLPQLRNASMNSAHQSKVMDAIDYLQRNYPEPCSLDHLASRAEMSRFQFARKFSEVVGESPVQYLNQLRLRVAADQLLTSTDSITNILLDCGFNDVSHFYGLFSRHFGCTPSRWRSLAD